MEKEKELLAWDCPECAHHHSKKHYSYEGQIDYTKKPNTVGRVKFDREVDCESAKGDTPKKYGNLGTGPAVDKNGIEKGLFCPHCGYEQEIIIIKNTYKPRVKKQ